MKFCISNIAWDTAEDNDVFELMLQNGFTSLELAPGKYFSLSELETPKAINLKAQINTLGINIVSLQGILFNTNNLFLFEDENSRNLLFNHLKRIIDYAHLLGVTNIVFGCPKNRVIGSKNRETCIGIAIDFFKLLGDYAKVKNTIIGLEPNAKEYSTDFLITTEETIDFLNELNHEHVKLNFDLSTAILNNENIETNIMRGAHLINHVHVSEPFLKPVSQYETKHLALFTSLQKINYRKNISIEMAATSKHNLDQIQSTIEFVKKIYK